MGLSRPLLFTELECSSCGFPRPGASVSPPCAKDLQLDRMIAVAEGYDLGRVDGNVRRRDGVNGCFDRWRELGEPKDVDPCCLFLITCYKES